ncbi:hypothetical protein HYH03_007198 [Edaphochlamys debaryana]|uniref:RING-type domain-containing protein n=1 Tax=Edaphochlamys debaryana TaxID=47281 RepID=A0A836C076_9CHLO|nr:hypothetical protein HYH03_007198 [Edaphochlamys debaryana]|eukprot:KAG2494682.1 hypothetical protein HYH03_007198 [Edaphochlamys debaryana]
MHIPGPAASLALSSSFGGSASDEAAAIIAKPDTDAAESDALGRAPLSPLASQAPSTPQAIAPAEPAPCNKDPAPPDDPGPPASPTAPGSPPEEPQPAAASASAREHGDGRRGPQTQSALPRAIVETGAVEETEAEDEEQAGAAVPAAVAGADPATCVLCMKMPPTAEYQPMPYDVPYTMLACGHVVCLGCMRRHVRKSLEARAYPVLCPQPGCRDPGLDMDFALALAGPRPLSNSAGGVEAGPQSGRPSAALCHQPPRPNQPCLPVPAAPLALASTPAVPMPPACSSAAQASAVPAPATPQVRLPASVPVNGQSPAPAPMGACFERELAAAAQETAALWLPASDWDLMLTDSPYWIERRAEVVAAAMAVVMARVVVGTAMTCRSAVPPVAPAAVATPLSPTITHSPMPLTGKKRPRISDLDRRVDLGLDPTVDLDELDVE